MIIEISEVKPEQITSGNNSPLDHFYTTDDDGQKRSRATLAFAGFKLDESKLLTDVRLIWIQFYGEYPEERDREAWADPLRVVLLERLCSQDKSWYLSFWGDMPFADSPTGYIDLELDIMRKFVEPFGLECAHVQGVADGSAEGGKVVERFFFECPLHLIEDVILRYWPRAYPGHSIQGHLMTSGQINKLKLWNTQPRDDRLFSDIINTVDLTFFTEPSEHRHFVFVTNKMTAEELSEKIGIADLERWAVKLIGPRKWD